MNILAGVITFYAGVYIGQPFYCGGIYTPDVVGIAVDLGALPYWRCGDPVIVWDDGVRRELTIVDAGPLSLYNVGGVQIVGDVTMAARWFDGLSTTAVVINPAARDRLSMEAKNENGGRLCQ